MLTLCAREYIFTFINIGIGRARRFFLPRVTLPSVVTTLVLSNLDNCNAMLSGATAFQLGSLMPQDHITPVLKELQTLPVELRIHCKVLVYIHKALRGQAPQYLQCRSVVLLETTSHSSQTT